MKFQVLSMVAGAISLISGCGNLNDSSLSGDSATVSLTIQNPDPNAKGVAKALSGVEQSKAVSSSSLSTCTLSASGPASASTTVTVPSGASQIETSLDVPVGSGYTITAECLDSDKTSNGVGAGIRGSAGNVKISGSDSVSISALFLNLASRSSGDARYCRIKQDNTTQLQIVCGFNGALTAAQKTTAQCNIEVDTSLAGTSPTTVSASQGDGFVVGAKGRPYFILGPGSIAPACHEYNTSGTKILKCTGSWSTDTDGNTVMQGALGVTQAETIATGRNARFAATCSKDGSTWVSIPSSGMAEFKTSGGGNGDVSLIANGSTCSTSRNGETCGSGFCAGSSLCVAPASVNLAADVTDAAGPAGANTAGEADGAATTARFDSPPDVCIRSDGNAIYVTDFSNHTLRSIDLTRATTDAGYVGVRTGVADSAGTTNGACVAALLNGPESCVVNAGDTAIFVTESGNDCVRKVDISGSCTVSTFAGTCGTAGDSEGTGTAARFTNPKGIDIDSEGTLYVADKENNKIRKITSAGVVTTLAGSGTAGSTNGTGTAASFNNPRGVVLDPTGTFLYVGDVNNASIRKINVSSGVVTTFASSLTGVIGVAMDPTGTNLYATVQGTTGGTIQKIAIATGTATVIAGSSTAGLANGNGTSATFASPEGLAFDLEGDTLYIADTLNNKIRKIQ